MTATKGVLKSFIKIFEKHLPRSWWLRIYSFTKNEVSHRCSSRILVAPSAGSFKDSHFQASFVAPKLLWYGLPPLFPFLDLPHIMPHPPINIVILSIPYPFFNILTIPSPPFINLGVGVGGRAGQGSDCASDVPHVKFWYIFDTILLHLCCAKLW